MLGARTGPNIKDEPHDQVEPSIKTEPYDDNDQSHHTHGYYGQSDSHDSYSGQRFSDQGDFGQHQSHQVDLGYTQSSTSQSQANLTGIYTIDCPQLAFQSPEDADDFRLLICVDNDSGLIWGGFELAWKTGVIKIDQIALNRNLSFGWRSTDHESGGVRFERGCFGEIEFFGAGQVRGVFHNLFRESMSFEGTRYPGPAWCGRSAFEFGEEWEDYRREMYGP